MTTIKIRNFKERSSESNGLAVKVALSPTVFATVSEIDWSSVYFYGEWRLVGSEARCKRLRLAEFIAKRMGLDCNIIAFTNGNPLNCTRENVFTTIYVWKQKPVRVELDGTIEDRNGWTYGNVGIWRQGSLWIMTHLLTGKSTGARWNTLDAAKHGVEAIHAERNLKELDNHAKFKAIDFKRWRDVMKKVK